MDWQLHEWIEHVEPLAWIHPVTLKRRDRKGPYVTIELADWREYDYYIEGVVYSEDGKYIDSFWVSHILSCIKCHEYLLDGVCGLDMYADGWEVANFAEVESAVKNVQGSFEKVKERMIREGSRSD